MAKNPDGRKRKRERLTALTDSETSHTLQNKEIPQQTAELIQNVPSMTDGALSREKTEWALQPHISGQLYKAPQMEEYGAKGKDTQSTLQRIKQTEDREQKSKAIVKRLSADLDIDEACSKQLDKLRIAVERLGGKLEDGWHVNSQIRSNNGLPFFIFMSPTNERFRSRLEVARHLGLQVNPTKSSPLGRTRSISNSRLALVPYVRKNKSLKKLSRGSSHKPLIEKRKNRKGKAPKALKAVTDVNEMQVTSTSSASPSFITQRCQDVLRSIIATESFAALSNMVNQGTPATSLEANLQFKAPSFAAGSLDLQLIHLRLSTGAYGQTPELFSADIQQVWKNIITAGNELVILAGSLSELSDNLYKQQIKNLFDGPWPSKENTSNEQSFGDTYVHVGPLPERIIARPDAGEITASGYLARPAGLSSKDGSRHRSMPSTHQAIRARLQRNYLSKQASTKARYQLNKKMLKKAGQAKKPPALKGRLAGSATESFCQKCGLNLGAECIACKQCQASYHTPCVFLNLITREWYCPLCSLNQVTDNPWKGVSNTETRKELCLVNSNATIEIGRELQKSTGKTGVCEACKIEDDNVLLCDGCDAAYHMSCLSPSMDSVPDGYWYCPACDEAGKKTIVSQQDAHARNCVVCERVSRELSLCAENESTAQVFFKEISPVYLAPERSRDNGYAEHSLDQGALDPHCVQNKSSEAGYLAGTENACKLCGVDEGKKSILCSNCRRCYHLSCLRPALRKRPRKIWFCPSCLCRVCKTDADDDKILLCDSCDEGYHTYCLKPPIPEIPEEAWYCPACMEAQNTVHTPPSKTEAPKKKRKSYEPRKAM